MVVGSEPKTETDSVLMSKALSFQSVVKDVQSSGQHSVIIRILHIMTNAVELICKVILHKECNICKGIFVS